MGIYACPWCILVFEKIMFLTNGMRYIDCWWIILLSLLDLCCLKTWGVWIPCMKDICICGMRLAIDVTIDDFNWYVVMMIFTTILIWDEIVNDDHVNMNWWSCQFMSTWIYVVDNVIEMRKCWCSEWYWNELLMMLEMHYDDACCVCSWGVHWPCRMSLVVKI